MRVIDIFPFCDEIDLAVIRINHLAEAVDHFFVAEYDTSFSGLKKDYCFERVLTRLPISIARKILYFPLTQESPSTDPFGNDDYQKNYMVENFLKYFERSDIIISGDCDEFPTISAISRSIKNLNLGFKLCHLAQRNFLGYLNVEEVTGTVLSFTGEYPFILRHKWLGTVITNRSMISDNFFSGLRQPRLKKDGRRIAEGGWHFSSCNGEGVNFQERFREKYRLTSHQELNREEIIDGASRRLIAGKDPLLRKYPRKLVGGYTEPKFRTRTIDNSFPSWLLQNSSTFEHLILDG